MLRLLFFSNSPWSPTGYGNQTDIFAERLTALGHQVTVTCFYGLQGGPIRAGGILFLPGGSDPYGNDVLVADAEYTRADIVLTLVDAWVFRPEVVRRVRWTPWLPVDHDPVPPLVVEVLRHAYRPIAYSRWGQARLAEAGIRADYVPHGVRTTRFRPMDRRQARRALEMPEDAFVAGLVAANKGWPSRKAFDQQIRAFARFRARHPEAMLYLHTDMRGVYGGENLDRIIELAGLPRRAVAVPGHYAYMRGLLDAQYMNTAYNAMDVLLNATRGEGFGVPILEAQSAGTPVIVTDFSAMPELCFAGWRVGWSDKHFSQDSYQVTPDVDEIEAALEQAYARRGDADLRAQARAGALAYDADHVTEAYWRPALARIEAEIGAQNGAAARNTQESQTDEEAPCQPERV